MQRDSASPPTLVEPPTIDGMFAPFGENSMHSDWHKNYVHFLSDSANSDDPFNRGNAFALSSPMSMKLPYDLPLFAGIGDQDILEWTALFERTVRACQVNDDCSFRWSC